MILKKNKFLKIAIMLLVFTFGFFPIVFAAPVPAANIKGMDEDTGNFNDDFVTKSKILDFHGDATALETIYSRVISPNGNILDGSEREINIDQATSKWNLSFSDSSNDGQLEFVDDGEYTLYVLKNQDDDISLSLDSKVVTIDTETPTEEIVILKVSENNFINMSDNEVIVKIAHNGDFSNKYNQKIIFTDVYGNIAESIIDWDFDDEGEYDEYDEVAIEVNTLSKGVINIFYESEDLAGNIGRVQIMSNPEVVKGVLPAVSELELNNNNYGSVTFNPRNDEEVNIKVSANKDVKFHLYICKDDVEVCNENNDVELFWTNSFVSIVERGWTGLIGGEVIPGNYYLQVEMEDENGNTSTGSFKDRIMTIPEAEFSVSGNIWNDANGDGLRNNGEENDYVGSIEVTLYPDEETPGQSQTVITNEYGAYFFENVPTGDYHIEITKPEGYSFSPQDQGENDSIDSDFDKYGKISLNNVEGSFNYDAGIFEITEVKKQISGIVWNDANKDGLRQSDEEFLEGINVNIELKTDGPPPVPTLSSVGGGFGLTGFFGPVTTNEKGEYSFDNLGDGQYKISIFSGRYIFSLDSQGSDESIDSDFQYDKPINDHGYVENINIDSDSQYVFDAGIQYAGPRVTNIWGKIVEDNGYTGKVKWTINFNEPVNGFDISDIAFVKTDSDLIIENAVLEEVESWYEIKADYRATNLNGSEISITSSSDWDVKASSDNEEVDMFFSGDFDISDIQSDIIDIANGNLNYDISGVIWNDENGDGIRQESEGFLANQVIYLIKKTGTFENDFDMISTNMIQTKTSENGMYYFNDLENDEYKLAIPEKEGYELTYAGQGIDEAIDSDFQYIDNIFEDQSVPAVENIIINGENKYAYDAGFKHNFSKIIKIKGSKDTGFVSVSNGELEWEIKFNEEVVNFDINDITIVQTDSNVVLDNIVLRDLNDGVYKITADYKNAYGFSDVYLMPNQESWNVKAVSDDLNVDIFTLEDFESNTVSIGGRKSISGVVWNDENGDGIRQENEPLVKDLILDVEKNGSYYGYTQTDQNGRYVFIDLESGNYEVSMSLDKRYVFSLDGQGSDGDIDSDFQYYSPLNDYGYVGNINVDSDSEYVFDAGIQYTGPRVTWIHGFINEQNSDDLHAGSLKWYINFNEKVKDFDINDITILSEGVDIDNIRLSSDGDILADYANAQENSWAKIVVNSDNWDVKADEDGESVNIFDFDEFVGAKINIGIYASSDNNNAIVGIFDFNRSFVSRDEVKLFSILVISGNETYLEKIKANTVLTNVQIGNAEWELTKFENDEFELIKSIPYVSGEYAIFNEDLSNGGKDISYILTLNAKAAPGVTSGVSRIETEVVSSDIIFSENDIVEYSQDSARYILFNGVSNFIETDSFEINENETIIGTVRANDNDTLIYSLPEWIDDMNTDDDIAPIQIQSRDGYLFEINSQTGELKFKTAPDFENPQDYNEDNIYTVVVAVKDSEEGQNVLKTFTVTVNNIVSDFEPEFDYVMPNNLNVHSVYLWENENDPEKMQWQLKIKGTPDSEATIIYTIETQNPTGGMEYDLFEIDKYTGILKIKDSQNYEDTSYENHRRVVRVNVFNLLDGEGNSTRIKADSMLWVVNIKNKNEYAPTFVDGSEDIYVPENTITVKTILARDFDGDQIKFEIKEGELQGDKFEIDENTGELKFKELQDFENPQGKEGNKTLYQVNIKITEVGTFEPKSSLLTHNIILTDVDEDNSGGHSSSRRHSRECKIPGPKSWKDIIAEDNKFKIETAIQWLSIRKEMGLAQVIYSPAKNRMCNIHINDYEYLKSHPECLNPKVMSSKFLKFIEEDLDLDNNENTLTFLKWFLENKGKIDDNCRLPNFIEKDDVFKYLKNLRNDEIAQLIELFNWRKVMTDSFSKDKKNKTIDGGNGLKGELSKGGDIRQIKILELKIAIKKIQLRIKSLLQEKGISYTGSNGKYYAVGSGAPYYQSVSNIEDEGLVDNNSNNYVCQINSAIYHISKKMCGKLDGTYRKKRNSDNIFNVKKNNPTLVNSIQKIYTPKNKLEVQEMFKDILSLRIERKVAENIWDGFGIGKSDRHNIDADGNVNVDAILGINVNKGRFENTDRINESVKVGGVSAIDAVGGIALPGTSSGGPLTSGKGNNHSSIGGIGDILSGINGDGSGQTGNTSGVNTGGVNNESNQNSTNNDLSDTENINTTDWNFGFKNLNSSSSSVNSNGTGGAQTGSNDSDTVNDMLNGIGGPSSTDGGINDQPGGGITWWVNASRTSEKNSDGSSTTTHESTVIGSDGSVRYTYKETRKDGDGNSTTVIYIYHEDSDGNTKESLTVKTEDSDGNKSETQEYKEGQADSEAEDTEDTEDDSEDSENDGEDSENDTEDSEECTGSDCGDDDSGSMPADDGDSGYNDSSAYISPEEMARAWAKIVNIIGQNDGVDGRPEGAGGDSSNDDSTGTPDDGCGQDDGTCGNNESGGNGEIRLKDNSDDGAGGRIEGTGGDVQGATTGGIIYTGNGLGPVNPGSTHIDTGEIYGF